MALTTSTAFANIGSRPFHSAGWIGDDFTLNPTVEKENSSVNVSYDKNSGDVEYKGGTKYDVNGSEMALIGNTSLEDGILGITYQNSHTMMESNTLDEDSGEKRKITTDETTIGGSYLHLSEKIHYFAAVALKSYKGEDEYTVDSGWYYRSTGTNSKSDSATISATSFHFGALYHVSEELSVGWIFSPVYGGNKDTENPDGRFYYGEGDTLRVGAGYNTDTYSAGIDFIRGMQDKDTLSGTTNTITIDGYFLLKPDLSLKGAFEYEQEADVKDGDYESTSSTSVAYSAGVRFQKEKISTAVNLTIYSETADAKDDGDFDNQSGNVLSVAVTFQF